MEIQKSFQNQSGYLAQSNKHGWDFTKAFDEIKDG
jgi:hypothetical protein